MESLMSKLFRNDSPGALTLEQARERAVKQSRERRRQAAQLAAQGRGEDTEIQARYQHGYEIVDAP